MTKDTFSFGSLGKPLVIMLVFWLVAVVLWRTTGRIFYLYNFLYIGTAIGAGIGLYVALPKRQKLWGRRFSQLLVGMYMLVFLGLMQSENMQIEGFFFYLLAGLFAGSVIHYLVAKIFGPLLFNRGWCGWACWTAMVLDLLPFRWNKRGRLPSKWGYLRYAFFGLSLGLVLTLWFILGYRVESSSVTELYWLIGGNTLYYAIAVPLAFVLQDNRAFCKYVCPITTVLKPPSHLAMLKVAGDSEKCNDCGACTKLCPMDILIPEYIKNGQRVLSTECILCFECVNLCPQNALYASFSLDAGNRELLNMRSCDAHTRETLSGKTMQVQDRH
jgi:Fe-S-cluster-containing hydrogenase component 2